MVENEPQRDSDSDPEHWVDLHGDYLFNFAYSRLHDEVAAQDVVQETFLAAIRAKRTFAGQSSVRTWLTGILKHKVIDYYRRLVRDHPDDLKRRLPVEEEPYFQKGGAWAGHWYPDRAPVNWGSDPRSQYQKARFWEIFDLCVGLLPPQMAGAFILSVVEELPAQEVCKELSISSTNLWVTLHRARKQLRSCIEKNWIRKEKPGA